jgi:hypothetical protein
MSPASIAMMRPLKFVLARAKDDQAVATIRHNLEKKRLFCGLDIDYHRGVVTTRLPQHRLALIE